MRTACAGFAHAPIDQISDAEFLTDLLGRGIFALEGERRGARGHVQPGNFLQDE